MKPNINSLKWIVFLKVMDGKILRTVDEFLTYSEIFGEPYVDFLSRNKLKLVN